MNPDRIYLIKLREHVNSNENIYKIGKTKQSSLKRYDSYPKGSVLLYHVICNNCNNCEKEIIKLFKNKYKSETNIGNEYFSGDYIDMINDIHSIVYKNLNATKGICVKADDANVEAVKNESKGEDVKGDGAKVNNTNINYLCDVCNKKYSSYQSLWNHYKKFHQEIKNDNTCKYCNKSFSQKSSLNRHYKNCNYKLNHNKKDAELIKKQIESNNNNINMIKEIMLKLMNDNCKVKPKTLTKINNNMIIQLGNETLCDLLTDDEKINILNNKYSCLDYLVKYIHFNDKYPQFKNILITNMKDDLAYRFDSKENKFIAIEKSTLIDNIISERMGDITLFYNELVGQLEPKTKKIIETIIDKMDNDKIFINNKKKDIKLIIYNNRDKVSKEITQDLEIIV